MSISYLKILVSTFARTHSSCLQGVEKCSVLLGVWPDFRFGLRIFQRSKLSSHSPFDCRRFAAVLEAGEVRTIEPREWAAQSLSGGERGVMNHINQALVIGISLLVPRKITKVR